MLSTLGKIFSRQHFETICMKCQILFFVGGGGGGGGGGGVRKISLICHLLKMPREL